MLTVTTAAELIGRSVQRANDAINQLVAAGVLKQTTIGRRNRAFETPDLIKALTGFERALASPLGDTRQAPPAHPVPYTGSRLGRPGAGRGSGSREGRKVPMSHPQVWSLVGPTAVSAIGR